MKISMSYARGAQVFLLFCAAVFAALFCKRLIRPLFVSHTYECIAHGVSPEYIAHMQEKLIDSTEQTPLSVIAQLKESFPAIKDVSLMFQPHRMQATIIAYSPLCIINDELVLVDHGCMVDKNFFTPSVIASLPSMYIPVEKIGQAFIFAPRFLHSLGMYHCFFHAQLINDHCVYLTDKDESQFIVVSTVDDYISKELFSYCEQIKNKLRERGSFKKNDTWLADIRFADHIIVHKR